MECQIRELTAAQVSAHSAELSAILQQSVNLGASIGWLAPMPAAAADSYWQTVAAQVAAGDKILLAAFYAAQLVASAQLALEPRLNGNHRAEVQKLIVDPAFRRRGLGRRLMTRLEMAARAAQRSLLVLDVRKGDPAEKLYRSLGYCHFGDVPAYARSSNLQLDTCAFYYKLLAAEDQPG